MFDRELQVLGKLLGVAALRHQVHARNIANLNTPGYKQKSVLFEQLLEKEQVRASVLATEPQIVEKRESKRLDGNSVVLEEEIQAITANHLKYQFYLQALAEDRKSVV